MNAAEPDWGKQPLDLQKEVVDVNLRNVLQRRYRVYVVDAAIGQRNLDAVVEQELEPWVSHAVASDPLLGLVDHRRRDIQADDASRRESLEHRPHHIPKSAADLHHYGIWLGHCPGEQLMQGGQIPLSALSKTFARSAVMDSQLGRFERLIASIPRFESVVHRALQRSAQLEHYRLMIRGLRLLVDAHRPHA